MSFRCGELALPLHHSIKQVLHLYKSSASLQKFCIFTKVMHLSEVHCRSELSHLSEVRSRQSTTSHNIIRLLRSSQFFLPETEDEAPCAFCGPSIKPQMPEVFHICFVGMNKSTVYFSLAYIHVVRIFVVALSLHLSRGHLCLPVHCLIDGILIFCVHTHLAFFFYIVAYCLCFRCRCTIHSVRLPHVSACPFLLATGSTEYFSFVSKRIVASCL